MIACVMASTGQKVLLGAAVSAILMVLGVGGVIVLIRSDLQQYSDEAIARFPGGRVQALVARVECNTCAMQDRNHAVWALGQMRVEQALPVLREYYDGRKCTHETRLCQYELEKAIRMIETKEERSGLVWDALGKLHQPWR